MHFNFVRSLLTNKFGIILVTLNAVAVILVENREAMIRTGFEYAIVAMNIPAAIAARIALYFFQFLFFGVLNPYSKYDLPLTVIFIVVQWLLMAHAARALANQYFQNRSARSY